MSRETMAKPDVAWLHMDRPTNHMVINSVLWFGRPLAPAALAAVLEERLTGAYPRFRQVVVERPLSGPAWEDDPRFDLRNHIHHVALPAPGDRAALQALVGDLASDPLDPSRPLWSAHLIDGYGRGCAVLMRMHHCIADGIALARVLMSLTDGAPAPDVGDRHGPDLAAVLGALPAAARAASDAIRHPDRLVALVERGGDDARALAKLLLTGADAAGPLKGPPGVPHAVAWTAPVALARVKAVGARHDATINDVVVTATAGALHRHLRAAGGPRPDVVHALVPFNLRPLDRPLPRGLGNRFGLVLLGLPVGDATPRERLEAVKAEMDAIKRSHEGAISYGILGLIGRTPAAVEARLVDHFASMGTLVLTNVPGPRRTVRFAGVPLKGVLVWAPASGDVALSVSVFTYAGRLTAGFLTDAGVVPEPSALARAFAAELGALASA